MAGPNRETRRKVMPELIRAPLTSVDRDLLDLHRNGVGERFLAEYTGDGWLEEREGAWHFGRAAGHLLAAAVSREAVQVGVVDAHGSVIARRRLSTDLFPRGVGGRKADSLGVFMKRLRGAVSAVVADADLGNDPFLRGCVVAWPAPVGLNGRLVRPVRKSGPWRDADIPREVEKVINDAVGSDCPVVLVNDADAEGLAEVRTGVARGSRCALVVKIGGGIGSSLIVDGCVHRGARGEGGEIGHVPVSVDDQVNVKCSCGSENHLEVYASFGAIAARLYPRSPRRSDELADQITTTDRADVDTWKVLEEAGERIGQALVAPVLLVDPDAIVLCATPHHDAWRRGVKRALETIHAFDDKIVVLGTSPGDDGQWMTLRGAGLYAWDCFMRPAILQRFFPEALAVEGSPLPASAIPSGAHASSPGAAR